MKHLQVFRIAIALLVAVVPWAVAEDAFFDSDGVQIRYTIEGEGEPVVLIHGFIASVETNWMAPGIFAGLAKDYRVIGLDNRGHGKSGKPHGKENYGAKMAKDAINLLDELGIAKAHFMGYSMGGFITTNIVCEYPDRVISAIIGGAGWMRPTGTEADGRNAIAESLENGSGIGPLFDRLRPEGEPAMPKEQLDAMNNAIMAMNDPIALAAVIRGMEGLFVTEAQLKANRVPVLAIIGEVDPLREGVTEMEKVMATLDVVVIDGANHMTAFGNPAFLQAAQEHLSANALNKQSKQESDALVAADSRR